MGLTHLEGYDTYVKVLFTDHTLAFNAVVPLRPTEKLLGLTPSVCNWKLHLLIDRLQTVRVGKWTSCTTTVSIGNPNRAVF